MSPARKSPSPARRKTAAMAAPRRAAKAAVPAVLPAVTNGTAAAETAVDAYSETMMAAQEQLGRASAELFLGYERLTAYSRGNVEALLQSGSAAASGVESLGRIWLELAQSMLQSGAVAAKSFGAARTMQEFVELQTDLARGTFDRLLADGLRAADISAKAANEAVVPLQARVEATRRLMARQEAA